MGCDIHVWFERREKAGEPWHAIEVRTPCGCDCDCEGSQCYFCKGTGKEGIWHRHYAMFRVLAGVRNEYGKEVVPVAKPRGYPRDLAADHPPENAGREEPPNTPYEGFHTPSWLTLRELQEHRARFDGMQVALAIVELEKLGGSPDDLRMVFAFDN